MSALPNRKHGISVEVRGLRKTFGGQQVLKGIDLTMEAGEMIALDEALSSLAKLDERKSRVVELKYFAGLTNEEIAGVLEVSPETVKRDWRFARTWLLRELSSPTREI